MRVKTNLRAIRGRRGIRDLERESGIDRGTLSKLERGRLLPTKEQIPVLERAYGEPMTELYDWIGPAVVVEWADSEEVAA